MMNVFIKKIIKMLIKTYPRPAMTVDNVYAYLDALWKKKNIDGPIVEVGVASGGMTAFACRFLSRISSHKQYYCIDTFGGFVKEQLNTDHNIGLDKSHDNMFSANSISIVRRNLSSWDLRNNINLLKIDICNARLNQIPDNISVCLLDVDLRDPIYHGLKIISRKLSEGGVILVDDCKSGTSWVGADQGYRDFMSEMNLSPKYYMGFGVYEYEPNSSNKLDWNLQDYPNEIPKNYYA